MSKIAKYFMGSVEFDIIGGNAERFFNDCIKIGVPLQNINVIDFGFNAQLPLRYFLRLHKHARKHRCRLKVTKKHGLYFLMRPYRHRWGILFGLLLMLLMLIMFPRTVWSIQFHNFTLQEEILLREQLYSYNICEGSVPTTNYLMQVQQSLFVNNESYGWIKLNFVAGKLVIEKISAVAPPAMEQTEPAAIVALCDGVIERIEVEGGFIEKKAGQSVKEGEVIISALRVGRRDKLHTERAEAKIYAFVNPSYQVSVPFEYTATTESMHTVNNYSLYTFGININMPFSKKINYDEHTTILRSPVTIFGMPLPATLIKTQQRQLENHIVKLTEEQAIDVAKSLIYEKLAQDLPECTVISFTQTVDETDKNITLTMEFNASANIAKVVEGWNL